MLFCILLITFHPLISADCDSNNVNNTDLEDRYEDISKIVIKNGYPFEIYHVTTPDGYILEIHRIPHGKTSSKINKRNIVLLEHALSTSSSAFIFLGTKSALAYILADAGYDVWMGNHRGNRYSRNHTDLDPDDKEGKFWDFSWHEMGYYDIPTMIDFVLETTNQTEIFFIGHSLGTTVFYVMASERPEYNDKIIASFSMGAVAYIDHTKHSLLRILAPYEKQIGGLLQILDGKEFMPSKKILHVLTAEICGENEATLVLCANIIFLISGFSPVEMNITILPFVLAQTPAGTSVKTVVHYIQQINSGRFCQFDYGLFKNEEKYGFISPPDYNLSAITTPIYIFYSENDAFSDRTDVYKLHDELPNSTILFIEDQTFTHTDYIFGSYAAKYVYERIINIMNSFR